VAAVATTLSVRARGQPIAPNRLWCADYKGEFLLTNQRYCPKERYAFTVFERAFQEFGLPEAPATRYTASPRLCQGLEELDYPAHDWSAVVTRCGRICYQARKINLSQVFARQKVGVKQTDDYIWLVTFMDDDLGYFDDETCRLEPICLRNGPLEIGSSGWIRAESNERSELLEA
jgi:hypothetical protein